MRNNENSRQCLATITHMLPMFKDVEENMTKMRRNMNAEKSQMEYTEKKNIAS